MKGEEKVLNSLREDEWFASMAIAEIATAGELDDIIGTLYEKIDTLREKHAKLVQNNNEQSKPWWNVELEIERKRIIALRKRYQKSTGPEREGRKREYYDAHKAYVENIAKAKKASWRDLCSAVSKGNPFNLPYKMARNKLKKPLTLGLIQKANSEFTATEEETVKYLIESLYPTISEFPEPDSFERSGREGALITITSSTKWKWTSVSKICAIMSLQDPMISELPSGKNSIATTRVSSKISSIQH